MCTPKARPDPHKVQVLRKTGTNLIKAFCANKVEPIAHLFVIVHATCPSPHSWGRLVDPEFESTGHVVQHLELAEKGARAKNGEDEHARAVDYIDLRFVDEVDCVGIFAGGDDSLEILETFHVQAGHYFANEVFIADALLLGLGDLIEVVEEVLELFYDRG